MNIKTSLITIVLLTGLWSAAHGGQESKAQKRLTAREITVLHPTGATAGTSGVAGITTRVLKGDPHQRGLYTIQLTVPANTRIDAHEHPDDRIATVISGTWYLGYGSRFDKANLKALPPGSFYTEPPHDPHFAQTLREPVVVQITGFGPTSTHYETATSGGQRGQ